MHTRSDEDASGTPKLVSLEDIDSCDDIDRSCAKNEAKSNHIPTYTINPGKRPGFKFEATRDTIVICPKAFNAIKTCAQALKDRQSDRTNLNNFLCKGKPRLS